MVVMDDCRRSPTKRDIVGWVDRAMADMKEEVGIIHNAWSKTGYKWFAKEGGREEENGIN